MTVAPLVDSPSGSARGSRWLAVAATALAVGVVVAPFRAASVGAGPGSAYPTVSDLREAMTEGFVRFWSAGDGAVGASLGDPVGFWARFHIVKAALAAALLLVLVLLGGRVWRAAARSGTHADPPARTWSRRLGLGVTGLVGVPVAFLALLVVVANLQGAIAPLSSALGLIPFGRPDPSVAQAVGQIERDLAAGSGSPALDVLVQDFTRYHVAMAVIGTAVTVSLVVAAVRLWRRRRAVPSQRRGLRLVLALAGVALVAVIAFFGVVTAANVSTALRPVPALIGFLQGGG